jgi:hypothetical protein
VQGALQYNAVFGPLRVLTAAAIMERFPRAAVACGKHLSAVYQKYGITQENPMDGQPEEPVAHTTGTPVAVAKL